MHTSKGGGGILKLQWYVLFKSCRSTDQTNGEIRVGTPIAFYLIYIAMRTFKAPANMVCLNRLLHMLATIID